MTTKRRLQELAGIKSPYKHKLLTEQPTGSLVYYGCSVCPEGSIADLIPEDSPNYGIDTSGMPICNPKVSYNVPMSDTQYNDQNQQDLSILSVNYEYIGSDPEILQYGGPIGFGVQLTDGGNTGWMHLRLNPENVTCTSSGEIGGVGPGEESGEDNSVTYYGCSICPEGAIYDNPDSSAQGENHWAFGSDISGQAKCEPVISFDIPLSDMNDNQNMDSWQDAQWLSISNEYIGSDPEILNFTGNYNSLSNSTNPSYSQGPGNGYFICSGSGEVVGDNEEETTDTGTEVTEGSCKKVTLCPACPSNNNYNPDRSYEIGGNVASECGTWSINNCMTVDGATPELGQFVLVGSAEQVWMVFDVAEATTDTLQDKQSTGCPELEQGPGGMPGPQGGKPGTGGGNKFPQKKIDKKEPRPLRPRSLRELKKLIRKTIREIEK